VRACSLLSFTVLYSSSFTNNDSKENTGENSMYNALPRVSDSHFGCSIDDLLRANSQMRDEKAHDKADHNQAHDELTEWSMLIEGKTHISTAK
jgi:hypothetical protein